MPFLMGVLLPLALLGAATRVEAGPSWQPTAAVPQAGAAPCALCIAIVITPGQALALPERLGGLDILVDWADAPSAAVEAALRDIARKGGRPGLLVSSIGAPAVPPRLLRDLRVVLSQIDTADPESTPDALVYHLKTQFTTWRAATTQTLELGLVGPTAALETLLARDIGSYVDFVTWADPARDAQGRAVWRTADATVPQLTSVSTALQATRHRTAARWLWRAPSHVDAAARVIGDLAAAAQWLQPGLVAGSNVEVRCGPSRAEAFLNPRTLETVAIARCMPTDDVNVTPAEPGVERLVLASGESLIRVPAPAVPDRFASGVDVVGARRLRVEEIVARHQAAAARQALLVRTLISTGTLTLSFEAPGFPAPVTISSETVVYTGGGRTELAQHHTRVNGMAFPGGGVPRLPIIEPERVASPPLAITLGDLYDYRLDGEARVDAVRCYIVSFRPRDRSAPLFSGRAWIAADSFAMVKVSAAQTGLRGPIVSSEQEDGYRRHADGVWLLARSDVRQIYEGAAHRTPIHRVLQMVAHDVNPPDFEARRQAAYASAAIMLRDTAEGFRYLRREPASRDAAGAEASPVVIPEVAGRADRVRTLAAGVIVDPNISTPLPFAGLSYVDFNLFGTGAQLNAFFGGSYAQLAFSVPSLGGTRWQLAGRAFGIASSYNDRAFVNGREQYQENIRQRPAHGSVWLLKPLTPRISLRAGYDLDYTHFSPTDVTASAFVVPASAIVHGARLALEGQRGGWQGAIWWNPAIRVGWREWGMVGRGDYDSRHRRFQRYGLSLARSLVLTPRLAARVEGAWMAGRDLDRFSRYAFGTFDNRLRGYPSALIRFDRGAVARSAIAWSAGPLLRVDGFLDSALVRDAGFGAGFRNYTGIGAALEAPAPFGLLLAGEWGYGLRGVNADGGVGTHVIRLSAFKIF
jgi:hypothetical protein